MWKTSANISAPTRPQVYHVEDGSPKGGMSTAKGRATAHKFCKGDIRPRGQWPKYRGRRLKRRVTTKGFASPVPIPPPPDPGSGPAGPAIFAYFPSLESRPPEAEPENEHHKSNEEDAKPSTKPDTTNQNQAAKEGTL